MNFNISPPKQDFPIEWIEYNIKLGDIVRKGDKVGSYRRHRLAKDAKDSILISQNEGKLIQANLCKGDILKEYIPVAVLLESSCSHAVQLQGLCAICGKDLSTETPMTTITMTHDAMGITLSLEEAQRVEKETTDRLLKEKKLSLVLDLDQTIIHATVDSKVGEWIRNDQSPNHELVKDVYTFKLPESPIEYYLKLRPGAREFLAFVNNLFELHIYTMGTRNYANEVARIIDPDQNLFKERILSRDESGSFVVKSIQRLFPCDQSMVLVVDDRGDVWSWSPNLIKVFPYNFFIGIGDINEPDKPDSFLPKPESPAEIPSILNTMSEESRKRLRDNDNELQRIQRILQQVHTSFFELKSKNQESDVRTILPLMKASILKNTKIVFSGVIPLGEDPKKNDLWQIATSFGATVSDQIDSTVTHVVAAKKGTLKVNQAKKIPGMYIVSPDWLVMCSTTWSRVPEKDYIIEKSHSPIRIHMKRETSDSSSDNILADEDDYRILSATHDTSVSAHFNTQEWMEMNREVEEAMEDDSDNSQDSIWNMIDEGLEQDSDTSLNDEKDVDSLKRKRNNSNDSLA